MTPNADWIPRHPHAASFRNISQLSPCTVLKNIPYSKYAPSIRHSVGRAASLPGPSAFPPAPRRAGHQAHRPRVLRPMGRGLDQGPWQSFRRRHQRLLRRPWPIHPPLRLAIPSGGAGVPPAVCGILPRTLKCGPVPGVKPPNIKECAASCRALFLYGPTNSCIPACEHLH